MPAIDLSVPLRELLRPVQSGVPGGPERGEEGLGRSRAAAGLARLLAQTDRLDSFGDRGGQEQLCSRVESIPSGAQHRSTVGGHNVVSVCGGHEVRSGGARAA